MLTHVPQKSELLCSFDWMPKPSGIRDILSTYNVGAFSQYADWQYLSFCYFVSVRDL